MADSHSAAAETTAPPETLQRVPLHNLHMELGAKMVPFAGYEMPVQYAWGMLKEHQHVRAAAGLFDVSHMGQVCLRPRKGHIADAALALERLVPADIIGLAPERQRYALFTNRNGGIIDDLMVANFDTHLFLVVNASRKELDGEVLRAGLDGVCDVEVLHRALFALQGPQAEAALAQLAPAVTAMKFMDATELRIADTPCIISRSGYTGEDGFEISIDAEHALKLVEALLAQPGVEPIGLAARDSLRLEAGLCLYGNDIDETTSPVEAALEWSIGKARRPGGSRAGGFPGANVIFDQLTNGAQRRRVGIRPEKRPARAGALLFAAENASVPVGRVTSGGFGATVDAPVSMGYVNRSHAEPGTPVFAEISGRRYPAQVADLPFVAHRYKRG